jgi:hypothetical protein
LDRGHFLLAEAFFGRLVVAEIQFGSDEDDRYSWGVVLDLGVPLRGVSIAKS